MFEEKGTDYYSQVIYKGKTYLYYRYLEMETPLHMTKVSIDFQPGQPINIINHKPGATLCSINHNFSVFLDKNGNLKAISGSRSILSYQCHRKGVYLLSTENGIDWKIDRLLITPDMLLPQEICCYFDGLNQVIWNEKEQLYYVFTRYNPKRNHREAQYLTSPDLITWSESKHLKLPNFTYTVGISLYNDVYYAFPTQYVIDRENNFMNIYRSEDLSEWEILKDHFMTSSRYVVGSFDGSNILVTNNGLLTQQSINSSSSGSAAC